MPGSGTGTRLPTRGEILVQDIGGKGGRLGLTCVAVCESLFERMSKSRVRRKHYDHLAMMVCEEWTDERIAQALGISVAEAYRFSTGKGPPGFNAILKDMRLQFPLVVVETHRRLAEFARPSLDRIQQSIHSENAELATSTAKWVIDKVLPEKKSEGPTLTINNNTQVNHQLADTTASIRKTLNDLKRIKSPDFTMHLKSGTEALPAPVQDALEAQEAAVDAEVIDVPEGAPDTPEEYDHDNSVAG